MMHHSTEWSANPYGSNYITSRYLRHFLAACSHPRTGRPAGAMHGKPKADFNGYHVRGRVDGRITKSELALHTCGLAGQCVLRAVVALAQILVILLPMVFLQWHISRTKIQRMTDYSAIFC
jgi:hypothetical protein